MLIQTIGVVGAGVMGRGVAQNLAQTNHQVILIDIAEEILRKAKQEISTSIRFMPLFTKSEAKETQNDIVGKIRFSTNYRLLSDVDFVIENVTEKWEVKQEVYRQLDAICSEHCVVATNTSAHSISRLASLTKRASRIIGIHFMNPVPLKSMVEVIRGKDTSKETIETATSLLAQMGKTYVIINDSPGFISNRVLMLMINEAIFLLQEGVASAKDVDQVFKSCFNHKMGPLETADLIGLDTVLFSIEVLHESMGDSKYRPCPLLKEMVDAGLHGRKSGQGFYQHKFFEYS